MSGLSGRLGGICASLFAGSAVIEPPDSALDALETATTRRIGFVAPARSPEISQWRRALQGKEATRNVT